MDKVRRYRLERGENVTIGNGGMSTEDAETGGGSELTKVVSYKINISKSMPF